MNSLGISELIIVLLSLILALVPFVGGVLGILAFVKVNRIERVLKEKQILIGRGATRGMKNLS